MAHGLPLKVVTAVPERLWYAGCWRTPEGIERHRDGARTRHRERYAADLDFRALKRHLNSIQRVTKSITKLEAELDRMDSQEGVVCLTTPK